MTPALSLAPAQSQPWLLQIKPRYACSVPGQRRNAFGSIAQEIACQALDLDPIAINGNYDVCFDASDRAGHFYEIKSVISGGKSPIYDWRMKKEKAFSTQLSYLFVIHARSTSCDPWLCFRKITILKVPFDVVERASLYQPLRQLVKPSSDPRHGYSRSGYREGYRNLPIKLIEALPCQTSTRRFQLYDEPFKAVIKNVNPA